MLTLLYLSIVLATGQSNITENLGNMTDTVDKIEERMDSLTEQIQSLQNQTQSDFEQVKQQHSESSNTSGIQLFTSALVGVSVPVGLYWYSQYREKRNVLKRSSEAILREIQENREALEGKKGYEVIEYTTEGTDSTPKIHVKYTNAFLDIDAYYSVATSGQFTHFKVKTQYVLTALYSRIKSHNETIEYTNEYEDLFFMNNTSADRERAWQNAVERYERSLSKWEAQILELLPKAEDALNKEIKKRF